MCLHSFCCCVRQGTGGEVFSPGHSSRGDRRKTLNSRTQTFAVPGVGRERGAVRSGAGLGGFHAGGARRAERRGAERTAHGQPGSARARAAALLPLPFPAAASSLVWTKWSCRSINAASRGQASCVCSVVLALKRSCLARSKGTFFSFLDLVADKMWGRCLGMCTCKCKMLVLGMFCRLLLCLYEKHIHLHVSKRS